MKPTVRAILLAVLALALGAGAAFLLFRAQAEAPETAPASPASRQLATPAPRASTPVSAGGEEAGGAQAPAPAPGAAPRAPLLQGEAAHEAITDLVVTYEPAAVPGIARYLAHSDPELRAAARDGLIQLGERAAIPFLEAAAKTAPAEEAVALREAAEFLALPTWSEHRSKQGATKP